ncbi:unnamed protein product [Acanthosepion pharaonis]|uniref:Secreted protein n=1 Tax=Acanthosepion pharaonis TaxID=158019 RepID=A0A812B8V0_ACAPH|nr:unnamed protein product [Sepia pharaonis]
MFLSVLLLTGLLWCLFFSTGGGTLEGSLFHLHLMQLIVPPAGVAAESASVVGTPALLPFFLPVAAADDSFQRLLVLTAACRCSLLPKPPLPCFPPPPPPFIPADVVAAWDVRLSLVFLPPPPSTPCCHPSSFPFLAPHYFSTGACFFVHILAKSVRKDSHSTVVLLRKSPGAVEVRREKSKGNFSGPFRHSGRVFPPQETVQEIKQ